MELPLSLESHRSVLNMGGISAATHTHTHTLVAHHSFSSDYGQKSFSLFPGSTFCRPDIKF